MSCATELPAAAKFCLECGAPAGDVVVQNGTRHRWHNRDSEPATMVVVIIGAHHAAV